MPVKAFLDTTARQLKRNPVWIRLPRRSKLATYVEQQGLDDTGGKSETVEEEAYALREYFCTLVKQNALSRLAPKECRRLIDLAWHGKPSLSSERRLFQLLLGRIDALNRRSIYRRLFRSYLNFFDPTDNAIQDTAVFLKRHLSKLGSWAELHKQWNVLNPRKAHKRLLHALINQTGEIRDQLTDWGIGIEFFDTEFYHFLFRKLCERVIYMGSAPQAALIERIISWAVERDRFLFPGPENMNAFARALLIPWRDHQPPQELQKQIERILITVFGDPRTQPIRWAHVSENAVEVLVRWLTAKSVHLFLDIIDETADHRMWHYRRKFWEAYLNAGFISKAWPVLGPASAERADHRASEKGDSPFRHYGKLIGAADRHQSALLLQLGDVVIAEWSHNGKWRLWPPEFGRSRGMEAGSYNEHSPRPEFYQSQYLAQRLRNAPIEHAHINPDGFFWQRQLSEYIKKYTGIQYPKRLSF